MDCICDVCTSTASAPGASRLEALGWQMAGGRVCPDCVRRKRRVMRGASEMRQRVASMLAVNAQLLAAAHRRI